MAAKGKVLFAITMVLGFTLISSYIENKSLENIPANIPMGDAETPVNNQSESDDVSGIIPELKKILVDTEIIDGSIVEKYQEFEIYKNKNGEVIKSVPTAYYDYIKYSSDS